MQKVVFSLLAGVVVMVMQNMLPMAGASDTQWFNILYPYRLEISVNAPEAGKYEINISQKRIAELLSKVCPEPVTGDAFSHDGVVVTTSNNVPIGKYELFIVGPNIVKDGDFKLSAVGEKSPWRNIGSVSYKIKKRDAGDYMLWTKREKIINNPITQSVKLDKNDLYLLRYNVYSDVQTGDAGVAMYDPSPSRKYFAELPSSYHKSLSPQKSWTPISFIQRATVEEANLRVNMVITGEAALADIRLNKVAWHLVANLPKAGEQKLYIYYVPRAGRAVTQPPKVVTEKSLKPLSVTGPMTVDSCDAYAPSFCADFKEVKVWQVDSTFPLTLDRLAATRPSTPCDSPIKVTLARGERRTILLAVQASTPEFTVDKVTLPLPVQLKCKRIAAVPIYKSWKLENPVQKRLDPMVDINYPLVPMHKDAPQILAFTLYADQQTPVGKTIADLTIDMQTSYPKPVTLKIPLELNVLPVVVKPLRHVQSNFAGHELLVQNSLVKISVIRFYGYDVKDRYETRAFMDSLFTFVKREKDPLRDLADSYWDEMLDNCVQPMTPTLLYPMIFKVTDISDDGSKAPVLSDWDWELYDKAIDRFVKGREMSCFTLMHTNGTRLRQLTLANGKTYGLMEKNPAYEPYVKMTPDAYYKLVGDFFDAWAKHLDEKGVLDAAYICVDESLVKTYPDIRRWSAELKSRPYARRIKIYHTLQHTAYYTQTVDGKNDSPLLLGDAFDIIAPETDDNIGTYYDPSYWDKKRGPDPTTWVYYVDTERLRADTAGLNTVLFPLQFERAGVKGFHHWILNLWSFEYAPRDVDPLPNGLYVGPCGNPWLNPFYHHGPGLLSFFYPPDPRGIAKEPTNELIPSYRLHLMRDGIEDRALLELLKSGKDDTGQKLDVSAEELEKLRKQLDDFWVNTVQWRVSRPAYNKWKAELYNMLEKASQKRQAGH